MYINHAHFVHNLVVPHTSGSSWKLVVRMWTKWFRLIKQAGTFGSY